MSEIVRQKWRLHDNGAIATKFYWPICNRTQPALLNFKVAIASFDLGG
ncbi:MAG: hypothetical protein SXA11_09285 [Cyanobacteriota bacterium]|nr:hypothetical protein [Cyanobacteriota bacterium]